MSYINLVNELRRDLKDYDEPDGAADRLVRILRNTDLLTRSYFGEPITKEWAEDIALPSYCHTFEIGELDDLPVYLSYEKDRIFLKIPLKEDSYSIEVETRSEVIRLCDGLRVKRFEFKTWTAETALYRINPTTYCIGLLGGIPAYISFEKKGTILAYFLDGKITSILVKTKAEVLKFCKELDIRLKKGR